MQECIELLKIAPDGIFEVAGNSNLKFYPTYMEDEKRFAKALFIKKYPSSLSDRFLTELANIPAHTIISIDVAPISKDAI